MEFIISHWYLAALGVFILLMLPGITIVKEYEQVVVLRFGKSIGAKMAGFRYLVPILDQGCNVDMRVRTIEIEPQDTITKDSVSISVAAVLFFKVVDSVKSVIAVEDFEDATEQLAIATLRTVIGKKPLTTVLTDRDTLKEEIKDIIDKQTIAWGIEVDDVQIRDLVLPENLRRAMGQVAEAEREKEGRIINAEGEAQAALKLAEAAATLTASPGAMKLREFSTMLAVGKENNSTIIFMEKESSDIAVAAGLVAAGSSGSKPSAK